MIKNRLPSHASLTFALTFIFDVKYWITDGQVL